MALSRRVVGLGPSVLLIFLGACGDDTSEGGGGRGEATSSATSSPAGGGGDDAAGAGGGTTAGAAPASGPGGGAAGGAAVDPLAEAPLAPGVRLDGVTVLQSTSVPIVVAGAPVTPTAPLVAGRDAWFRAFLAAGSGDGPVQVEILVEAEPGGAVEVHRSPVFSPRDGVEADPASTAIVHVPAAAITGRARWAARVLAAGAAPVAAGAPHDARFPRDGSLAELGATIAPPLRITLVPFRWDADGSGRLPDTGPAALDVMRSLFVARFPVAAVELTVHDPVPYDRGLNFWGNVDFDDVNGLLYDLREDEAPAADVHVYGMLAPADSFDDYCDGSCVTGQSYVADEAEWADLRVGAGVAFDPESAAATAVHEVGHMFGRYHAPCGVGSWDEDYPYLDGEIGVLGWDPRDATPLDAEVTTDFMGYCDPQGTSDYTFGALFARLAEVAALPAMAVASRGPARPSITCDTSR